jgi:hypothetical protein
MLWKNNDAKPAKPGKAIGRVSAGIKLRLVTVAALH